MAELQIVKSEVTERWMFHFPSIIRFNGEYMLNGYKIRGFGTLTDVLKQAKDIRANLPSNDPAYGLPITVHCGSDKYDIDQMTDGEIVLMVLECGP